MCTLIVGRDVLGAGTLLLAANRDEDPARPSDPPGVLIESPRVVGGRDRVAGGTWLAVRERHALVAMLNRRDVSGEHAASAPDRRSRGLLALDVARVAPSSITWDVSTVASVASDSRAGLEQLAAIAGPGLSAIAFARTLQALSEARYAPFTMVFATHASCWLLAHAGIGEPRADAVPPGWHVLTHMDLDDAHEPRTAWLVRQLAGFEPRTLDEAERRLGDLLRSHGDPAAQVPAVCLHSGHMMTVSSSMVWLAASEARYLHAEGRPCEQPWLDHSHLLIAPSPVTGNR